MKALEIVTLPKEIMDLVDREIREQILPERFGEPNWWVIVPRDTLPFEHEMAGYYGVAVRRREQGEVRITATIDGVTKRLRPVRRKRIAQ